MHYVIGTRGSKLALAQTEKVKRTLESAYPEDTFGIKIIRTAGDKNPASALEMIGTKGIFTDEIERELLSGEIAMAVHSMKDMPGDMDERLVFSRAWTREDPRDVLILKAADSLKELPEGAVIGTGSKRREYQLKKLRPDIRVVGIRGNVDTRINKLYDPEQGLDGIIIAAAGIKRLKREAEITEYMPCDDIIPAPAQGILAIEVRKDNTELLDKLNAFADREADYAAGIERQFLAKIGGDCHYPIGAYYDSKGIFYALFGRQDGSKLVSVKRVIADKKADIDKITDEVVAEILSKLKD